MRLKKNKKGAMLITLGLVAVVLFILVGTYVSVSIIQSQKVRRESLSLQAFYAAEKGIEYVFVESKNKNWEWYTHEVPQQEPQTNLLQPLSNPPSVTLQISSGNPKINSAGCYEIDISGDIPGANNKVEVKAYADPDHPDETIILSKGTVGSVCRLLKFRLTRKSFYKFFFYYPTNHWFWNEVFDGKGEGGIYVNGRIFLHGTTFSNLTELSTSTIGYIHKYGYQYTPPGYLDELSDPPHNIFANDGYAPLPRIDGAHIYTEGNPYPWQRWEYPPYPYSWPPLDWINVDRHFYCNRPDNCWVDTGLVNGVELPNTLSNWEWQKYWGSYNHISVEFKDEFGQVPANYWATLESAYQQLNILNYGVPYFDPDFWDTKTYAGSTATTEQVPYLNTQEQKDAFKNWLATTSLNGIVKEANTGGYDIIPPSIEIVFSELAKDDGLYIGKDESNQLVVVLNGNTCTGPTCLPSWISDNVQFYNTVRAKEDSEHKPIKENVLKFNLEDVPAEQLPKNGIIYIDHKDSLLVNATTLPKGLTWVSPYSFYVKGDYNTDTTWQPSAIISNSFVYLLSNNFTFPQQMPKTIYPPNYPYELEYIPLTYFVTGELEDLGILMNEINNYFGLHFGTEFLSNPPSNTQTLLNKIRSQYNTEYRSQMPNQATNTTYNTAIVAISDPMGERLERWRREDYNPGAYWYSTPTFTGAFIQIWNDDGDGIIEPGEGWAPDIYTDVPFRLVYYGKRTGSNSIDNPPIFILQHQEYLANAITLNAPKFNYETRFSQNSPPGGFFGGSQERWDELVCNFNNFNYHNPIEWEQKPGQYLQGQSPQPPPPPPGGGEGGAE